MNENETTKLTLTIGDTTVSWEKAGIDCTFDELLSGFLGCMFGQTFVPGTEVHVFQDYLKENNFNHGYKIHD